ncbi:MAG TPA: hypothetical protein DD381_04220 [Lentisphaeria bacterium]|nr:MAG: hypothetical protein A2X47_06410 [Lentisphaerae bacterium GWF2_38_69]HBM15537.1 hypothetical protein [Lentisphaeria bacterium]
MINGFTMHNTDTKDGKFYSNVFIIFCAIWFIIWSFIPFFLFEGVFCDVLEYTALVNHDFSWGYDKQPYFGVWLTGATSLFGDLQFSYLCCQLCVIITAFAIWKLASYFLPPAQSLLSVIFILITPTYFFFSFVFCQNIILQALWALILLYFYRSLVKQKAIDWLLLGLFCGLGLMTKYFTVFLFVPMALFIIFSKEGRASFSKAGIYLCAILFLLIILPNFIWLLNNDFIAFTYGINVAKLDANPTILYHILSPLHVVGLVVANFIISIIMLFSFFSKRDSTSTYSISSFDKKYINLMCFSPLLLIIIFAFIEGSYIKMEWLFPTIGLFGIFAIMYWRPSITRKNFTKAIIYSAAITVLAIVVNLFALMYYFPYKYPTMYIMPLPANNIAKDVLKEWYKAYHTPIKFVLGPIHFSSMVSNFDQNHPRAIYMDSDYRDLYPEYKSAIDKYGAILIWYGKESPKWLNEIEDTKILDYQTKSYNRAVKPWFEKLIKKWTGESPRTIEVSFAFIPPKDI